MPSTAELLSSSADLAGSRLLLAVSGGRDSMCLLYACAEALRTGVPWSPSALVVASVHHGLRGEDADADLQLVADFSRSLGLEFHAIYLNPNVLLGSGGLEQRARTERYCLLQNLREERKCDWICTAHHASDQAETLLLRMLRGTGLLGLRGILARREDRICRPFLDANPDVLSAYAIEKGIPWRLDRSNLDWRFTRNRVRHGLLPQLQQQMPELRLRLLELSKRTTRILGKIAPLEEAQLPQGGELHRVWLGLHGQLLDAKGLAQKVFPRKIPTRCRNRTTRSQGNPMCVGGIMYLLSWQFWSRRELGDPPKPSAGMAWVAADQLSGEFVLRTRQEGDRFSPPGLRSRHRKLKKFLQERGIPFEERDCLPLVALNSEVLWIPGHAVSGNYQVQTQTGTVLELRLECRKTTL